MAILDSRLFPKNIEDFGNTVTIREVSKSVGTDEYRIITETTTDHTSIKCTFQVLSESDDLVKQGDARNGDLIFWFDLAYESYCIQGNRIQYDSKWFEIYDVHKFDIADTTYIVECRTRKV